MVLPLFSGIPIAKKERTLANLLKKKGESIINKIRNCKREKNIETEYILKIPKDNISPTLGKKKNWKPKLKG